MPFSTAFTSRACLEHLQVMIFLLMFTFGANSEHTLLESPLMVSLGHEKDFKSAVDKRASAGKVYSPG